MSEVIYKKCPNCGAIMERDESKVLTSIPPLYQYFCPKCGQMEHDTYPPVIRHAVYALTGKGTSMPDEWELFRREAAKDIVCGIISMFAPASIDKEFHCKEAIRWADELIKQLKDESTR